MEWLYPYIVAIGEYREASSSLAIDGSKTCRSPHKGTESHQKNKYLFRILPTLLCCSGWIHRQEGNREKASRQPQWKYYDFTMFLSRITTSRCIAVDWYLRVYWLLPRSIVASFKKHRRFFCLESTILLESTDDSFAEHHEYLGQSINFISQRIHFQTSPDSFSLHQLNQQTPANKTLLFFVDKTVISDMLNSGDLLGRAKICTCSIGGQVSMRRSLSFGWRAYKKGNDSRISYTCHFLSH